MAMAKVELKCSKCGKTFAFSRNCYNRKEANNLEEWAEANITLCPCCRSEQLSSKSKKTEEEKAQAIADWEKELNLPEIEGSEKQIKWAKAIRRETLLVYRVNSKKAAYLQKAYAGTLTEENFNMDKLKEKGWTIADATDNFRKAHKKEMIMAASKSAKEIIENR